MRQAPRPPIVHPELRFTAPDDYAQILRQSHQSALSGASHADIDVGLWDSWQRSLAAGIDPDQHVPRHLHDVADVIMMRRDLPLAAVMPALSELLGDSSTAGQHLLVMSDAYGEVLWRVGSPTVLRKADELEFVEGADWSEAGVGTNAISTAVVSGRAAQLFSAEHLVRTHHEWVCTASPIRNPGTGKVLGILTVSGPLHTVTVDTMRMVNCGVRLAEELLKTSPPQTEPWRSCASGIELQLLGDSPAVLSEGRRIPLSLRRAEILALLDSRSRGWSADELAYEIRGETGAAAAVRIEMHRIRNAVGGLLESNPYRLAPAATGTSDVSRILRLMRRGHIAEALETYTAPLLNRSNTLVIESLRLELNAAVGSAVRASGSVDLLRRWCSSDMGSSDSEAIREMGRLLGTRDPAYLTFQARSERFDRDFGT